MNIGALYFVPSPFAPKQIALEPDLNTHGAARKAQDRKPEVTALLRKRQDDFERFLYPSRMGFAVREVRALRSPSRRADPSRRFLWREGATPTAGIRGVHRGGKSIRDGYCYLDNVRMHSK